MDAVVVGAGVVGLSCAVALQEAGIDARVVAREDTPVSEVAGGLWLPYSAGDGDRVLGWARESYAWLLRRGFPLVDYHHVERLDGDPWWAAALPPGRIERIGDHEWLAQVPLAETPALLAELRDRAGGVEVRDVRSLDGLAPLVVNCAGLAAGALAGDDDTLVPVRGQVALVEPPPGAEIPCVCDEDELTYVLPRRDVVVCGGFAQPGDTDTTVRDEETRDILARCTRLVPALQGARVLGARAGLRPSRPAGVRLERAGDVIHCYGHGGAGVTLAWGCALEVAALVAA